MDHYLERVVDLLDPALNRIHNMTLAEARERVLSAQPAAVREIDGSFALLAPSKTPSRSCAQSASGFCRCFARPRRRTILLAMVNRVAWSLPASS